MKNSVLLTTGIMVWSAGAAAVPASYLPTARNAVVYDPMESENNATPSEGNDIGFLGEFVPSERVQVHFGIDPQTRNETGAKYEYFTVAFNISEDDPHIKGADNIDLCVEQTYYVFQVPGMDITVPEHSLLASQGNTTETFCKSIDIQDIKNLRTQSVFTSSICSDKEGWKGGYDQKWTLKITTSTNEINIYPLRSPSLVPSRVVQDNIAVMDNFPVPNKREFCVDITSPYYGTVCKWHVATLGLNEEPHDAFWYTGAVWVSQVGRPAGSVTTMAQNYGITYEDGQYYGLWNEVRTDIALKDMYVHPGSSENYSLGIVLMLQKDKWGYIEYMCSMS